MAAGDDARGRSGSRVGPMWLPLALGQQSQGNSPKSQGALEGQVGTGYRQGEGDWARAGQEGRWGLDGPVRELVEREELLGIAGVARLEARLGQALG